MGTFKPNKLLDEIEKSKEYKAFQKLTQEALIEQWEELIYSGLATYVYNTFKEVFSTKIRKSSETRQAVNQAIISGKVGSMTRLQRFITDKATGKIKTVGQYSGYGMSVKTYLYKVMNKGGQAELDKYLGTNNVKFSLTADDFRRKITERMSTLIKGIDKTTVDLMTKELIKGLENGVGRNQLVKNLMQAGQNITKVRAERIARTETNAAVEYMRHETAKLNGVQYKTWITADDEKTCRVCRPLNGTRVKMTEEFVEASTKHPPVHPSCRCFLEYDYQESLCSNDVKTTKAYKFYDSEDTPVSCTNPNAVWAGGNGLIGIDKVVGAIYLGLSNEDYKNAYYSVNWQEQDKLASEIENLADYYYSDMLALRKEIENSIKRPVETKLALMNKTDIELRWIAARARLTNEGFIQLMRKLGFKGQIPNKLTI